MRHLEIEVTSKDAGKRLDKFLASRDLGISRSRIQGLIRDGYIKLKGHEKVSPHFRIQAGDSIDIQVPAPRPLVLRPIPIPLTILYEDSHLLVLEKPAGLVVHPGAGMEDYSLVHGLLWHCRDLSGIGGYLRPGIVHRLDKDTSGLLVVAKDDKTHLGLTEQFKTGTIKKTYMALVRGHLPDRTGHLEAAIGRHPIDRKKMSIRSRNGRAASTEWQVLEELCGADLVSIKIHTGRTHQIRVHMSSIGHPVLGDSLYGGPTELRCDHTTISIPRQMLHASRLQLVHPITGKEETWESPLPKDMSLVLDMLRDHR